MLVDAEFQQIVQQVCHLIECDSVQLVLGCPEPALCHPLLAACAIRNYHPVANTGQAHTTSLLQNERLRALCDLAVQTGKVQSLEHWRLHPQDTEIQSIAVVPLEQSAGVLGLLLLTDSRAGAFYMGELLLLSRFMPCITQKVEMVLTCWREARCFCTTRQNRDGSQDAVPQKDAQDNTQDQVQRQAPPSLDRLKHEFISMVSHEIRNPLTAIKGYAVLLQAYGMSEQLNERSVAVMSPQRQREYLDHIMEQTQHLEVLINDLLDISRLHAGRLQLRYQQVNAVEICQRVVQYMQQKYAQSPAQHAEIACTFEPHLPCMWTDPDRLQQVLTNLLDNAMKYSPAGGNIEVSIALHQDMIAITVCDSGIGIAQEQQQHLFQPFKRLEHPLTHDIPGAGLGLYITRKLVEAMHGEITLSSSVGAGTTVTVTLPYAVHHLSPTSIGTIPYARPANLP